MWSLKASKAKIAITDGMVYASKEINDFIADPANKPYLVPTATTFESMDLLLKHEIDGILDDEAWKDAPAALGYTEFRPTPFKK